MKFQIIPASAVVVADPDRAAVIGYSRGGTVALLAGERDRRVGLVLDVVGPVDHFVAMDPPWGFRWPEILADDMRDGTAPTLEEERESSQVFDHFLDRVLTDREGLDGIRHRMLASSPLYFLEALPELHAHYGPEDNAVPPANPRMLRERLEELGMLGPGRTVTLYEGRGHDTDPYQVQQATVASLVKWVAVH